MKSLCERDGNLIHHWYIACLSKELKAGEAIKRRVYEKDFVLFRDENGNPVCLPDRCLHRATQLSEGRCYGGKLSCPYHGWTYNREGVVVEIPSEGSACTKTGKMRLQPLPCLEIDGCIWVFRGNPKHLTDGPWRFPHFGEKGWAHYYMITDFENEVTHLAENFMDVPHTVFVHKGWFRSKAEKKVPMRVETRKGHVLVTYLQKADQIGFSSRIVNPRGEAMTHTDEFIFPNITRVDYRFGQSAHFVINSQCTPLDSFKTRVYTYIGFRVGWWTPLLKPMMRFYTRRVIGQDVDIMRNQGANLSQEERPVFCSTEADDVHLAIEALREMGARGDEKLFEVERKAEKAFWI